MLVKYKGILKIVFGIYTCWHQMDFLKQGKFECQKDIHVNLSVDNEHKWQILSLKKKVR